MAHGHWGPATEMADDGRGGFVFVRPSIVHAATKMCESYSYTGRDNCRGKDRTSESVKVASGAANYQPVFYWIIGTSALPFDGSYALIMMRLVAAIMCALMLTLAYRSLSTAFRTQWPALGLLVGMTPVTVYSTAVAAPNGLEIVAGAATWAGLLALGVGTLSPTGTRRVLLSTALAATVLVSLRQLGPLWLALIVTTWIGLDGASTLRRLLRTQTLVSSGAIILVWSSAALSALWFFRAGPLVEDYHLTVTHPWKVTASQLPLWVMQSVAAFPLRSEPAPALVYAIYAVVLLGMLLVGAKLGTGRQRLALLATALLALAVPFLVTRTLINTAGLSWQGRYTLPFAIGLPVLCTLALERQRFGRHRLLVPPLVALWLVVLMAQAVSVVHVQRTERHNSAAFTQGSWWPLLPSWAIAALATVGVSLWAAALLVTRSHEAPLDNRDSAPNPPSLA